MTGIGHVPVREDGGMEHFVISFPCVGKMGTDELEIGALGIGKMGIGEIECPQWNSTEQYKQFDKPWLSIVRNFWWSERWSLTRW